MKKLYTKKTIYIILSGLVLFLFQVVEINDFVLDLLFTIFFACLFVYFIMQIMSPQYENRLPTVTDSLVQSIKLYKENFMLSNKEYKEIIKSTAHNDNNLIKDLFLVSSLIVNYFENYKDNEDFIAIKNKWEDNEKYSIIIKYFCDDYSNKYSLLK